MANKTTEILKLIEERQQNIGKRPHNNYNKYNKNNKNNKYTRDESLSMSSTSSKDQEQSQKQITQACVLTGKDSCSSPAPKLEIEKLDKVSFQLYKNENGTSVKGNAKYLYKLNIQFQINGKYYDFISEVNTRLDSFKRFGDHISDADKYAVIAEVEECREKIAKQFNINRTAIRLGKIREKGKVYTKGVSYKSPSIANTFVLVWNKDFVWHFAMRFENVWIEDILVKDDLTPAQLASNLLVQHIWYPEIKFKKSQVWKPKW